MRFYHCMTNEQQIQLCTTSTCHFVQYIFARYLCSQNVLEQSMWLLDSQRPPVAEFNGSGKVEIWRIYNSVDFLKNPGSVEVYMKYAREISQNYSVSILHKGLIANLLLLNQANFMLDLTSELRDSAQLLALTGLCQKISQDGKDYEIVNLIYKVAMSSYKVCYKLFNDHFPSR